MMCHQSPPHMRDTPLPKRGFCARKGLDSPDFGDWERTASREDRARGAGSGGGLYGTIAPEISSTVRRIPSPNRYQTNTMVEWFMRNRRSHAIAA